MERDDGDEPSFYQRNGNIATTSSASSSNDYATALGATKSAVDHVVHDPISSGFLAKYCDAHFCSENMRFVREIDRFRDQFLRDKHAWPKSNWKAIDEELDLRNSVFASEDFNLERDFLDPLKSGTLIPPELWPSQILTRESIIESLKQIWDNFLTKDATDWICIPFTALMNTMRRIKMIHIYGKEVFMEALIDPIKTIEKDIYPRFLISEEYRALTAILQQLADLPNATSLRLSKPPLIILQRYPVKDIEANLVKFSLNDLLEDQILYSEFLKYLEKIVSSENLLCLRAIRIFKQSDPTKRYEHAWMVYQYFIASGAAYEISISYRKKKEVMRKLADPDSQIFDAIEQSVLSALRSHFANYSQTKEYHELCRVILSKRSAIPSSPSSAVPSAKLVSVKPSEENSVDSSGSFLRSKCFSMR